MHKDLKDLNLQDLKINLSFQKSRWLHSNGTMKDWILKHLYFDSFGSNFWLLLPNSLYSFNHNKDRDDVYKLNREQEQELLFFPAWPTL